MRVVVMFDLPVGTSKERREYRRFRKELLSSGFIMIQESVYCKLALNQNAVKVITNRLDRIVPKEGFVLSMVITERQYTNMNYHIGGFETDVVTNDERLIIL